MPAKPVSINLIGREFLERSPQGRLITWALTYGRYIMIGTEIVVLLAFISRFSLDRKLTDLKDEIDQKQAILQANIAFETDIRNIQDRTTKIKTLMTDQTKAADSLKLISSLLPPDIYLTSIDVTPDKLTGEAIAASTAGFAQFLYNLQSTKAIKNIDIGDVKKDPILGIEFKFSLQFSLPKAKQG